MVCTIVRDVRDIRANLGVVGGGVDELVAGAAEGVSDVANDDRVTWELGGNVLSGRLGEGAAAFKVLVNHALDKLDNLVDDIGNGANGRGLVTNVGTVKQSESDQELSEEVLYLPSDQVLLSSNGVGHDGGSHGEESKGGGNANHFEVVFGWSERLKLEVLLALEGSEVVEML